MAAAAILEIEKSPYLGRVLTIFDKIWHGVHSSILLSFPSGKMSKILKLKVAVAAVLKNHRHISAAFWPISTKFDTVMQFRPCADANWDSSEEWKVKL